jgi:hypothetical protein
LESGQKRSRQKTARPVEYLELATTPMAPVELTLVNPAADNQPVVYIGDAARSVLTLTLRNQSNRDLTLKGAAAVPAEMGDTASTAAVYLDFGSLLVPNDLAGLLVSAGKGWQGTFLTDTKLWGLCPASDLVWPAKAAITITISNVVVSKKAGGAALDVYYVNFDHPGQQFREIKLLVQTPPGGKDEAQISAELNENIVSITPRDTQTIENEFELYLVNGQGVPLETGPDSVFYLSFIYGLAPGYGALMPFGSAVPQVAVSQAGGDGWAVHADTTGKIPCWNLRPSGRVALGTGAADTAVFEISDIVVPYDFVAGPTTLYVQWTNLPRYRDGHARVTIQKRVPRPSVSLQPDKDFADYGAKPVLTWQTVGVRYLQLSYSAYGKGTVLLPADNAIPLPLQCPDPVACPNGFIVPDPIKENATYYLDGFEDPPAAGEQVQGLPIAKASCDVTIQHPLPVISDFKVTPAAWAFELGPVSVTLSWKVDWIETFGERSLVLSGPGEQSLSADQTSRIIPNVPGPQKWQLKVTGGGGRSCEAEAEIKSQSVIDYLYHPPRRFKGATTVTSDNPIHTTFELILSDIDHNTYNITIDYEGIDQPIRNSENFEAKIEGAVFAVPLAGGDPGGKEEDRSRPVHFRITPGILVLADPPDSQGTWALPTMLYEEKS